jgi:hypothetical protein
MFTFDVPLIYGSSVIKLRYYGPFGEESFKEENVNIPYNFLPEKQFEYTISGGFVEDKKKFSLDSNGRFGRVVGSYGLSRSITMAGGVEYLSTVTPSPVMPFLQTSARITPNLLFFGEYTHDVRSKGSLLYRTVKNWQVEASYTKFKEGQTAINNNSVHERRLVFSVPIRMRKFSLFSMMTLNQSVLQTKKSITTAEWTLNGLAFGFDARISTYGYFVQESQPNIYSNISTVLRLPGTFLFTPEAQYSYTAKDFISAKGLLEKRVFRYGYVGLSFERNFKTDVQNAAIQLRYDIAYAQLGATARYFNKKFSFIEVARGSLQFDRRSNFVNATNSISIGRGGLSIMPFLDLNCNSVRDADEPKVSGLKFRIGSGRTLPENKDTVIHVSDLEAYSTHYIELNRFSFDNIAWQIQKKVLRVTVEPNSFKPIEVPIAVVAEVTGTVSILKNRTLKGQGQIYVNFYKNDSLVGRTLSESDGYFSYMGLAPGTYTAVIDSAQMQRVNMKSSAPVPFTVQVNRDGDIIDGLEFTVQSLIPDTSTPIKKDTAVALDGNTKNAVEAQKLKKKKSQAPPQKTAKRLNTTAPYRYGVKQQTRAPQRTQQKTIKKPVAKPVSKQVSPSQNPRRKLTAPATTKSLMPQKKVANTLKQPDSASRPVAKTPKPQKKLVDTQKKQITVTKERTPPADTTKNLLDLKAGDRVDSLLKIPSSLDSATIDSIAINNVADSISKNVEPKKADASDPNIRPVKKDHGEDSNTQKTDKQRRRRFLGLFRY